MTLLPLEMVKRRRLPEFPAKHADHASLHRIPLLASADCASLLHATSAAPDQFQAERRFAGLLPMM
jgi:hypothetical protein